jgi:hypothetical protein
MQQNKFLLSEGHEDVVSVDEDMDEHEKRNSEFLMVEKAMNG